VAGRRSTLRAIEMMSLARRILDRPDLVCMGMDFLGSILGIEE
jgi:hypothetical protein